MPRAGREMGYMPGRPRSVSAASHSPATDDTRGRRHQVRHAGGSHNAHHMPAQRWDTGSERAVEHADAQPATSGALALLDQPAVPPHPSAARYRILIVEDDPGVASVIRESLELEGEGDWAVQTASEGRSALELASASPPDVVLLDVRLPGLDGAEVYRRLRTSKQTRGARILFLTAGTSLDLYQRGIEDGVLLRKPFDAADLMRLVRALLEG